MFVLLLLSFAISGYVVDKKTGEPLPYVSVMIGRTDKGVTSNDQGYFFLKLPRKGSYVIKASYIGYEDWEKKINVERDITINIKIELAPKPIMLKGIIVTGTRNEFEKSVNASKLTITPSQIRSLPSFFESDIFRSIQILPGIVSMHDLSNKPYIRGGTPDELYVSLDHIKVYNPASHLFGLFSMFNPDIVKYIEFYTGAYPARYGGRLSGVLSILTKDGNTKKYQLDLSSGLISTIFTLQGPSPWGSFFISGRRTYFDLLVYLYGKVSHMDVKLPYYFYDIVGKTAVKKIKKTKISATFMKGMDVFNYDVENSDDRLLLKWGNEGESLTAQRILKNAFVNTTFSHTKFLADFMIPESGFYTSQRIENFSPSSYVDFFFGENNHLIAGLERNKILFTNKSGGSDGSNINSDSIVSYEGFMDWNVAPKPLFSLRTGLRGIYLSKVFYIEPRGGVKYRLSLNDNLLFSLGVYHQYIPVMNSQESFFSLYDFYKPVKENLPRAWQCVLGYEKWFSEEEKLKLEVYYKKYDRLLIPQKVSGIFSMPTDSLNRGSGYATGLETMLKKRWKNISLWLSYSLGFTKRRIGNFVYSPKYDRRHTLNVLLGYSFDRETGIFKNLNISFRFTFGSGLPFAAPIGWFNRWNYCYFHEHFGKEDTFYSYYPVIRVGRRDSGRLPPSHRLDLHMEKQFGGKKEYIGIYLDMINVYARKNVLFYEYNVDKNGNIQKKSISVLPIPIVTGGIKLRL